jgi:lipopolysaccharide export system protein LptA
LEISHFVIPTSVWFCRSFFQFKTYIPAVVGVVLLFLWVNILSYAATPDFMNMGSAIIIEADQQGVNLSTNVSEFNGNVIVTSGDTKIRAPRGKVLMDANAKPTKARFEGGVKITKGRDSITAPTLIFDFQQEAFTATGGVVTQVQPEGQTRPVVIKSPTQQYLKSRSQMLASGGVTVTTQDATATSASALLVLGAGNSAERITFDGSAHILQKDADITAQKVVLLPQANVFMAEGNAVSKVKQESKPKPIILRSAFQQLDRNKGLLIASGNVDLDFENYKARGPKATFYLTPGDKTELKKAVFSGRPTMNEGTEKQVTADIIEVTTNPTHFDARGSVKTRLVQKKSASSVSSGAASKASASKNGVPKTSVAPGASKAVAEEDEFDLGAFQTPASP